MPHLFLLTIIAALWQSVLGSPLRVPVEPYLDGVFPDLGPEATSDWRFENAFEARLTFNEPMGMVCIPNTESIYVFEKRGVVWLLQDGFSEDTKELALNITDRTLSHGGLGLRSFVLHPEFGEQDSINRSYVYVIYTTSLGSGPHPGSFDGRWRLSRFSVNSAENSLVLDPNTELVLVDQYRGNIHHGGDMFFGPEDGFLYFSNGDSYNAANTQQIDKNLYGGIFRIDVDKDSARSRPILKQPLYGSTDHYYIPNDNPFADEEGALGEFFALGLRNPYRITIDPVSGEIYCGDVGTASAEEINRIIPGGNYQWNYKEGFSRRTITPANLIGIEQAPIKALPRTESTAVIGGVVYRGSRYADEIGGSYLYADYNTGVVSCLKDPTKNDFTVIKLAKAPPVPANNPQGGQLIVDFSTDLDGEAYICQQDQNGIIFRLIKNSQERPQFPQFLSETGAFIDTANLSPSPKMIPYEVNSPLWSDGAVKKRWVVMPNDGAPYEAVSERAGWSDKYEWSFPTGTVFVKHFELPIDDVNGLLTRRIETRFLILDATSGAYGLTYRWNDDQTDAELVDFNGYEEDILINGSDGVRTQKWSYPSAAQCMQCHTSQSRYVLGANSRQLNKLISYEGNEFEENQLLAWSAAGLINPLGSSDLESIPKLSQIADDNLPEHRIRSYIDANCSHCHQPGGVRALYDARFDTPFVAQGLINGRTFEPSVRRLIDPVNPDDSYLFQRFSTLGVGQMPPLGKNLIHNAAVDELRGFIENIDYASMLPNDWFQSNIGSSFNNGMARYRDGRIEIGSSGYLTDTKDNILFVHRVFKGDFDLRVKVNSPRLTGEKQVVYSGLMVRENLTPGSKAYFLGDTGDGGNKKSIQLVKRFTQDARRTKVTLKSGRFPYQRLTRSGGVLRSYYSSDGASWVLGNESVDLDFQETLNAGIYFAGSTDAYSSLNSISFEELSVTPTLVDLTVSKELALEGGVQNGEVIVSRSGPAEDSLTVDLTWSGPASLGNDIAELPDVIVFAPGEIEKTVPIVALTDLEIDRAERLNLEIRNQAGLSSIKNSVSIGVGESLFEAWKSLMFDEVDLLDDMASGVLGDFDSDQLVTIQEFFFGTDPKVGDYKTIKLWSEDECVYLKYPRNILAANLTAKVEQCSDLKGGLWTDANLEQVSTEVIGNQEWITLRTVSKISEASNYFLRLKIEAQ